MLSTPTNDQYLCRSCLISINKPHFQLIKPLQQYQICTTQVHPMQVQLQLHQPATSNPSAKSFANQSKTVLSNSRIHGHMLVLTRPAPKPIPIPQKPDIKEQASSPPPSDPVRAGPESDSISLRPKGRTGSAPVPSSSPLPSPVSPSPTKSDRFVPPHLRPGFVGKEDKPGSELLKGGSFKGKPESRGVRPGQIQDPLNYRAETLDGRPKSGGGYEPVRKGRELSDLNRPGSSGTRPSSSG